MIWIVTDDPSIKEALTHLILGKGHVVSTLDCSADVAVRARFRKPKVIIIDCGMVGSFELVKQMRATTDHEPTALIMFAMPGLDLRKEALSAGADAFVPRGSLDWSELWTEIQRFAS